METICVVPMKNIVLLIFISLFYITCNTEPEPDTCLDLKSKPVIKENWKIEVPEKHYIRHILGKRNNETICVVDIDNIKQLVLYSYDGSFRNVEIGDFTSAHTLTDKFLYYYNDFSIVQLNLESFEKNKILDISNSIVEIKTEYINGRMFFIEILKNTIFKVGIYEYNEVNNSTKTLFEDEILNCEFISANIYGDNFGEYLCLSKFIYSEVYLEKINLNNNQRIQKKFDNLQLNSLYTRNFDNGLIYSDGSTPQIGIYYFDIDSVLYFPFSRSYIKSFNCLEADSKFYNLENMNEIITIDKSFSFYYKDKIFEPVRPTGEEYHVAIYNQNTSCYTASLNHISTIQDTHHDKTSNEIILKGFSKKSVGLGNTFLYGFSFE